MTRSEVAIAGLMLMGMAADPLSGYLDYLDLPENPFVPPDPETPKRILREPLKRTPSIRSQRRRRVWHEDTRFTLKRRPADP